MAELGSLVPEHWKFFERDNSFCTTTAIKEGNNSGYLHWEGQSQLKKSEYFFDDEGLAIGFRRVNWDTYYTLYPHRELNTYFRWHVGLDKTKQRLIPVRGGLNPQIWFGRLFVDHGSQRQQEEMKKCLGSVNFDQGHLRRVMLGRIFLNDRDLKEYPSLGQPVLNVPSEARGVEDFDFYLVEQAAGGRQDLAKVEKVEDCAYLVSSPDGQPFYTVSWQERRGALIVVQEHIQTRIRKTVMAKFDFNVNRAAALAVESIDPNQSQQAAMEGWLMMASEVGCHFSIGGGQIGNLFE